MADPRRVPPMAWLSAFDFSPWAGAEVFQRGEADPVTVPEDAGIYLDAIQALNGYGSEEPLDAGLVAEDCSITLNADDKLVIANNRGDGAKVTVYTSNAGAFGFDITDPTEIAPGETLVADRSWQRGMLASSGLCPRMSFTIEGVGGTIYAPQTVAAPMSLITAMRARGEVLDLDDVSACLEAWDIAENGAGIRWGITDEGRVYWAWRAVAGGDGITWLSATFRARLGFTGNEVPTIVGGAGGGLGAGGTYYMVADLPCPGVVVPTRPIAAQSLLLEEEASAVRLTDGSYSSNWIGSYAGWSIEWLLDGPDGARDNHRLWHELRAVYCHAGEPLTLYQSWGDPRRAIDARALADAAAYTLGHTSDRGGYRGRILARLHPDAAKDDRVAWDSAIRLRAPVTTRITVREAGV